jgi:hypothetical protein
MGLKLTNLERGKPPFPTFETLRLERLHLALNGFQASDHTLV